MSTSRIVRLILLLVPCFSGAKGLSQSTFDLDGSFRTNLNTQYVTSALPVEDGKLLVSGKMVFNGDDPFLPRYGARLNSDGSRDQSFTAYPGMGGTLTPWNDQFYSGGQSVRRLNMDGTYDPEFILMNSGPYFGSLQGGDYHVFPDGRVLMSGAHTIDDPVRGFEGLYSLIWFSNTGYLDTTRTHRYCNGVIYAIEEQPDGKFLCSGTMSSFEGEPVTRIFRVLPDGALDNTLQAGVQNWGEARDYHTLNDGRILTGGVFKLQNSTDTLCLLRLFPDGSVDDTFQLLDFDATYRPSGLPVIRSIYALSPDRLIVMGVFDKVNGLDRGGIAMIDSSGNLVEDVFDGLGCGAYEYVEPSGSSIYKSIEGIVSAPDGSFYIYGAYHGYDDGTTNDTTQRFVSRLYGLDVGIPDQEIRRLRLYPNPAMTSVTIELDHALALGELIVIDALGRPVFRQRTSGSINTLHVQGLSQGAYRVELRSGGERVASERLVLYR